MIEPYRFTPGSTPLLVSCPHVGTYIPAEIARRMTPEAHDLADTDWHIERLYDFARGLGAAAVPRRPRQPARLRPAPVAIHDDGDMRRRARRLEGGID